MLSCRKLLPNICYEQKKCTGISEVLCYVPVQTSEADERISWYFSQTSLEEIISIDYKGRPSPGTTCMHVDKLRAVNHTHNSQRLKTNTPFSFFLSYYLTALSGYTALVTGCLMNMEQLWNENWKRKFKYSEKTWPTVTFPPVSPTLPNLGLNPGRRGGLFFFFACKINSYAYLTILTRPPKIEFTPLQPSYCVFCASVIWVLYHWYGICNIINISSWHHVRTANSLSESVQLLKQSFQLQGVMSYLGKPILIICRNSW
jgi:hypothetical protein